MLAHHRFIPNMALCLATLFSARLALGETYTVDPAHTSVLFSVGHMQPPVSYTYGFFRKIAGSFVLDRTNPSACQFQFSIDVQSIDTNNAKRDEHLRGPGFFNAKQFQQITFQSTACRLAPAEPGAVVYNVTGNMTMLGQVRQVTLPLRFVGESNDSTGHRAGLLSQFTIKRSDFGMTGMLDMVGDAIGVTVSMEGVEQKFVARTDPTVPTGQAAPAGQPTPVTP